MARTNRAANQPRPIQITPNFTKYAEGSVLIATGNTQVLCTASVEEGVPSFMKGQGKGWVTAEYSMLPRSTHSRMKREREKIGGRTQEIQRLIGRSLRAVVDFTALGERTIQIDCDVIQADGGTRTASITGAYVALAIAIERLMRSGALAASPLRGQVAAISLGKVEGELLLDLDYNEDSNAEVDMNLIMNDQKGIIECQGTAEKEPYSLNELMALAELGWAGLQPHFAAQREAVRKAFEG